MKWLRRFTDWYLGNNEKEKVPPRTGWRRVLYLLANHGGSLILLNLLFLICCIPVITIPAAFTAMKRYLFKMYKDGYGFCFSDYFAEFKAHFGAKLMAGFLVFLICFYGYYLMSFAGNFGEHEAGAFLTGVGYGIFFLGAAYGAWVFYLFAVLELPLGAILKNAGILMILEWKETGKVILVLIVSALIIWAMLPFSVILVLLLGFSVPELIIGTCLAPAVTRRIFQPYEECSGEAFR